MKISEISRFIPFFLIKEGGSDEKTDRKVEGVAQEAIEKAERSKNSAYLVTGGTLVGAGTTVSLLVPGGFIVGVPLSVIGNYFLFKSSPSLLDVSQIDVSQQKPMPGIFEPGPIRYFPDDHE